MLTRSGFIKTMIGAVIGVCCGCGRKPAMPLGRYTPYKGPVPGPGFIKGPRRVFFIGDLHIGHTDIGKLEALTQAALACKHSKQVFMMGDFLDGHLPS